MAPSPSALTLLLHAGHSPVTLPPALVLLGLAVLVIALATVVSRLQR